MDGTRFGAYLGEVDGQFVATLKHAAEQAGLALDRPWRDLGPEARQLAMFGTGDTLHEVAWRYRRGKVEGVHHLQTVWAGFAKLVDREYERIHADAKGEELEALLMDSPCPACGGERLGELGRGVRFGGLRFPEVAAMSVDEILGWLEALEGNGLSGRVRSLSKDLRGEMFRRLQALGQAGLGYLSPQRPMASLSGGEAQRVRLAASLSGGLVGVTYVLDEPTQGLHPRDIHRLGKVLRDLAEAGNAVVVVEHERSLIAAADHVIELGPGAGPEGGCLVAEGSPEDLRGRPDSRTGAQLRRSPGFRRQPTPLARNPVVRLRGARLHNLKELEVGFPMGALVAVTGVSGSGKSSLVLEVLAPSLRNHRHGREAVGCAGIEVPVAMAEVITSGQEALGIAGNSTVLTLTGLGEILRKRFAATPRARALKLSAKHFSTATPGGRCEACEGRGVITVAMDLLPDVTVGCETCQGRRFKPEVLECCLGGQHIVQVLESSVREQAELFAGDPRLAKPLRALEAVGMGYLRLGQEASTLSEGERQRLRLAGLLAEPPKGKAAILLDEPTRGLGMEEVDLLVGTLRQLAGEGHLVVVVEHDPDFIAACDWVIDLGPEGGAGGGRLLVEGPPEQVKACPGSYTGQALAGKYRRG